MTAILPPRTWSAFLVVAAFLAGGGLAAAADKPRVIVTSDGEIDDECSLVRFLLYANEWDVEGIVTSSSQRHWQGHEWAGDDWARPYLQAYAASLELRDAGTPSASFVVPSTGATGQTLHLVCEVTDHGTPRLTRYRRVIVTMTRRSCSGSTIPAGSPGGRNRPQ
jgi:hypothetical protein